MAFYHISELTLRPLDTCGRQVSAGGLGRDVMPWCFLECIDVRAR